jgi:hypothetical protein
VYALLSTIGGGVVLSSLVINWCCVVIYKCYCNQKRRVHNLIEHPGKTPILHGVQNSEVPKLNRDLLIFSRPNFVQTSVCVHTQDLTQKQLASLKHSQLWPWNTEFSFHSQNIQRLIALIPNTSATNRGILVRTHSAGPQICFNN